MHKKPILFVVFGERIDDTRLPKCVIFGELLGARAAWGAGKIVDGVSPGRPQSFWYQRRPVNVCNRGRGGIAQDGRVRDRTFQSPLLQLVLAHFR